VPIGLGDVAARRLLMLAVVLTVLLMTMLLVAALLATLAVAALALLAAVSLAAVSLAAVTLAALIAWILALALHAGVHALRVRSTGIVERRRQALAHVLNIDVGDGKLATAHARPLAVIHGAQHTIVMVGMLQEILGSDPVASRTRVARELKILFQDLVGIAADPQLLPAAFVPLTFVLAATHSVRFARTTSASASVIVILFHV
jgi:hypothetical protein